MSWSVTHAELSQIRVQKNHFVTTNEKVIIFKGLCSSAPDKLERDGHWNKQYFEMVKSWGANCIRIPILPLSWKTYGKEKYVQLLDQGVTWATDVGLYVILDWHSIGNLVEKTFFQPTIGTEPPMQYDTTREETFDFWATMAAHYSKNTTVAFFELFNEPTFLVDDDFKQDFWMDWKALVEALITHIRSNGGKAIPLVAGFNYGYDLEQIWNHPIARKGIGYVAHPYPEKAKKPWKTYWQEDWGFVTNTYPVFLTEIGFARKEELGSAPPFIGDEKYGEAIIAYCEERGISYTAWCFDPEYKPSLIKDWSFAPTRSGLFFKQALQNNNPPTVQNESFLQKLLQLFLP